MKHIKLFTSKCCFTFWPNSKHWFTLPETDVRSVRFGSSVFAATTLESWTDATAKTDDAADNDRLRDPSSALEETEKNRSPESAPAAPSSLALF